MQNTVACYKVTETLTVLSHVYKTERKIKSELHFRPALGGRRK